MTTLFIHTYFYLLSLSPILAYFQTSLSSVEYYNLMGFIAQFLFFLIITDSIITGKKIEIPIYIYPLLLMGIYRIVWGCYNGELESRGTLMHYLNNNSFETAALLIVIENTNFEEKFIQNLFLIIKATIIVAGIFTVIQVCYKPYFATNPEFVPGISAKYLGIEYVEVRRKSIFGYLHRLGVGMSFIPIFAIFLSTRLLNKVNFKKNLPYLICAAIVCFGTNSRWIMLNFTVILGMFFIYSKYKVSGILKYILIGISAVIVFVALLTFLGFEVANIIKYRILGPGFSGRDEAIYLFIKFFSQNPFWGRGFHITGEQTDLLKGIHQIHIGYLSHLDQWGIVGSLFRFSFWGMLAAKLWKDTKISVFYGGFLAFFTFLIANITLVNYSIFHYGLLLAFVFNRYFLLNKNKVGEAIEVCNA